MDLRLFAPTKFPKFRVFRAFRDLSCLPRATHSAAATAMRAESWVL